MVTLHEELLQARAAVVQAGRDSEAIRSNPAFRRLEPQFCLLSQVHPSLRLPVLALLRNPLPSEIEALVGKPPNPEALTTKPGRLVQAVCKNLKIDPVLLNCEEAVLVAALACPVDRKAGKALQQFVRRLEDETRLVAQRLEIEAKIAALPALSGERVVALPTEPPAPTVREFMKLPENTLPARQRTCAHWEFENGPRCPNPVAVFPGGKESPYCEDHLGKCQNPQCPNGPDYRIPRRYQFCARCKDFPRKRRRGDAKAQSTPG